MNPFILYTYEGDYIAETSQVIYSHISLNFNDIGSLQITVSPDNPIMQYITNNKYLLATFKGYHFVIVDYFATDDEVEIYGRTLNWFLSKMVVPDFTNLGNKTVDVIADNLLSKAIGCSIVKGDFATFSEGKEFAKDTYTAFSDTLKELLQLEKAGHEVVFDGSNYKLNILKGNVREEFISKQDGTISSVTKEESIIDAVTDGMYKLNSDDTETWKSISRDTKEGMYKWYKVLSASSATDAKTEIDVLVPKTILKAVTQRLKHGVDYKLGDFLKIQYETQGKIETFTKQIIGVEITNTEEKIKFNEE